MTTDSERRVLRVGVVGLGAWGREHARAWLDLPGVELVAVCDRDDARARGFATSGKIRHTYTSAAELAKEVSLDVVSVVNNESSRLEVALPFIEAGVHVLVEKPVALDLTAATTLMETASKAGVILMPSHPLRFDSRSAVLKDRLLRGDLGRVRSVYCRRMIPRDRLHQYARTHPALMAGIHDFDLARWYFGTEPTSVRAFGSQRPGDPVPDIIWTVLTFPDGGLAVVETAWVLPAGSGLWLESETEVIGTDGVARISSPGQGLGLWLDGACEQPEVTLAGTALDSSWGALKQQLSYLAMCVLRGRQPDRVTAKDGVESLAVALAAVESLELGGADRRPHERWS